MGLYSKIVDLIDIDAFEEAIGFFPEETKDDNDIGHCPDYWGLHKHGDTTGKFAIHRRKRVYNCWVCGGGTLLSLAMQYLDSGEDDALDFLSEYAGEHRTDDEFVEEIEALLNADERERNPIIPWFNERVIEKWMTADVPWFKERGFTPEVIERHKLGFDPEAKKVTKKGTHIGPGIIIPHMWQGRLVGWQIRWPDERPSWIPKYTNTHDFPRTHTIFNFESVYLATDPIVVCESVATVLFLEGLGIPAVATFGGNVTDEQIKLLRRCQQGIIVAADNDKVGTEKFIPKLCDGLERFTDVKVLPLIPNEPGKEGADLGDLVEVPDIVGSVLQGAAYRDLN